MSKMEQIKFKLSFSTKRNKNSGRYSSNEDNNKLMGLSFERPNKYVCESASTLKNQN